MPRRKAPAEPLQQSVTLEPGVTVLISAPADKWHRVNSLVRALFDAWGGGEAAGLRVPVGAPAPDLEEIRAEQASAERRSRPRPLTTASVFANAGVKGDANELQREIEMAAGQV
jgi:hypothetical protein